MGVFQEKVIRFGPDMAVVKGAECEAIGDGLEAHMNGRAVEPRLLGRVIYFNGGHIRETLGGMTRDIAEIVGDVIGKPQIISQVLESLSPPAAHEDARRRAQASNAQDRDALRKPSGPAQ